MTPFSGPSQRSGLSPTRRREKPPRSPVPPRRRVRRRAPRPRGSPATSTSLPRPIVKTKPWPSCAAVGVHDDVGRRVVRVGIHGVRAIELARRREPDVGDVEAGDAFGHRAPAQASDVCRALTAMRTAGEAPSVGMSDVARETGMRLALHDRRVGCLARPGAVAGMSAA